MQTYLLSVNTTLLNLANVKRAEFRIKRAIVADSFIIVPDFKKIVTVTSQSFTVELLRNTPGSIYEVIMYDDKSQVLGAFFDMPEQDSSLADLFLSTSYPPTDAGQLLTFLALLDTPNAYNGHAGKVVAVKQDESGLEFIECSCGDPEPSCDPNGMPVTNANNLMLEPDTYNMYFEYGPLNEFLSFEVDSPTYLQDFFGNVFNYLKNQYEVPIVFSEGGVGSFQWKPVIDGYRLEGTAVINTPVDFHLGWTGILNDVLPHEVFADGINFHACGTTEFPAIILEA